MMSLGGDLSFFQGKDVHFLDMEDLCLIYPPLDGGGDGRHGEDHGSNLLVQSKRELVDEGELLFDSGLQRKMLEVGDVLLESIIGGAILFLERCLHESVMIHGDNLIFSIVHLPPLSFDLPLTFTVSVMFSTDSYQYIW